MKIKNFLANSRDKNLAWFLGFSVGDGYTTYGRFAIDTITPEICDLIVKQITKLTDKEIKAEIYGNKSKFPVKLKSTIYKKKTPIHSDHIKIKVDSNAFAKEMGNQTKLFIKNVENLPEKIACNFLQGFFDAEATVSPQGTVEIDLSTKNQKLADLVSKVLSNLGIKNKIQNYKSRIRVTVSGRTKEVNNLKKFQKLVGFKIPKKKTELENMVKIYSLPIEKRSKEEIIKNILDLLRNQKHIELKICMQTLNLKYENLRRCINLSGIKKFQKNKRVWLSE